MGFEWLMCILYFLIVIWVVTMLLTSVGTLLFVPTLLLTKSNKAAKVINALPMLYHGYSAICLPWNLNVDYWVL